MGTIIKRKDLQALIDRTSQGIFLLDSKVTIPVNSCSINIGLLLSERMYKAKVNGLTANFAAELDSVLGEKNRDIILDNPDILFSPEYGIDVIKLLLQVGRNQRLYLQWPGEILGEKLTFSELGRFDYRVYYIKDYIDTYVVLR